MGLLSRILRSRTSSRKRAADFWSKDLQKYCEVVATEQENRSSALQTADRTAVRSAVRCVAVRSGDNNLIFFPVYRSAWD